MSTQNAIQVVHKGTGNPFRAILLVLALLMLGACSSYPPVILHSGLSNEAPAILDTYCGVISRVLQIRDDSGRIILKNDDWQIKDWPTEHVVRDVELKPGQYSISYEMNFRGTGNFHYNFSVQMKPGHLYKFAGYFVMYEEGWLWIEDVTTSEVVAGILPPRDVKKKWRNHHAYCRTTFLDYL